MSRQDDVLRNVGTARGCIPPYPCGRGAGANGHDLPCDCEAIANGQPPVAERVRYLSPGDAHGARAVLSPGDEYVIDRSGGNVWVLWNAHGTPIGYLHHKPPEEGE